MPYFIKISQTVFKIIIFLFVKMATAAILDFKTTTTATILWPSGFWGNVS